MVNQSALDVPTAASAAACAAAATTITASAADSRSADPVDVVEPVARRPAIVSAGRTITPLGYLPPIQADALPARANRFTVLAGAVTLAAAFGSLAGAL